MYRRVTPYSGLVTPCAGGAVPCAGEGAPHAGAVVPHAGGVVCQCCLVRGCTPLNQANIIELDDSQHLIIENIIEHCDKNNNYVLFATF